MRPEAVHADYLDMLGPAPAEAVAGLQRPALLLLAPRGLLNEPSPLYPPEVARAEAARAPRGRLRVRTVEDVNHYSILFAPHGIDAVAPRPPRVRGRRWAGWAGPAPAVRYGRWAGVRGCRTSAPMIRRHTR